jgi:predicted nucleic acid-binding protein
MNGAKAFVDTNIFVYLYSETDLTKRQCAFLTINKYQRFVSSQVLNELCNVSIRKTKMPLSKIRDAVSSIANSCVTVVVDESIVQKALEIHEKYGYSYYDCLMIAAALESECDYLFSEDMSDGQVIDGLKIVNIFAHENI